MDRPLIYVAGPLTEPFPGEYIQHVADMNNEAEWLFEQGWAPIIPGNDFLLFYRSRHQFTLDEILEVDAALIRASWAIRVLSEYNNHGKLAEGVAFELREAEAAGVLICRTRVEAKEALTAWRQRPGDCDHCGQPGSLFTMFDDSRLCEVCLSMCVDM